ncbi:MAG: S41 family peptidase [Bdellovibrionales bacterium]
MQEPVDALGDLRAGLLIAHGTLNLFYPNFHRGARADLDRRLVELLGTAAANRVGRASMRDALRRLSEPLYDGHCFIFDRTYRMIPEGAGVMPVLFAYAKGDIVVAASAAQGVLTGDRLLAVDGVNIENWLARELAHTSAATDVYRMDRALRELQIQRSHRRLTLLSPQGTVKDVTLSPSPLDSLVRLKRSDYTRPSGWLKGDQVFYLNVTSPVLSDLAEFERLLREAQAAETLVLDLRASPGVHAIEMARRLIPYTFKGPQYLTPVFAGPEHRSLYLEPQRTLTPLAGAYRGKILLLTGPLTVSAAENFATYLVDAGRVTVIGQPSAGTNGTMTGLQLPGNFLFTFTGMRVHHANGSPYRGIQPQYTAVSNYLDFANGEDAVLRAALGLTARAHNDTNREHAL